MSIGTPIRQIIRAIPNSSWGQEQYFDADKLNWRQLGELKTELEVQGFFVQQIMLADPMHIQVAAELRHRAAEEQEKK